MKARQNAELELADTVVQLEDVSRAKSDLEEKHLRQGREKADLASQLQESEEELQDVMRKYKASVAAVSTDQITIQDQAGSIQVIRQEYFFPHSRFLFRSLRRRGTSCENSWPS